MKFTVGSMLVLLGSCLGEDQNMNLQQEAQKEVVIEAVDNCPLGAGRCGGGVAGNQYARGQMDNGASRMGQFAGQGNFGAVDSTAFAANVPYGAGGQMRMPPNMFYGSQFINQVQQCPPGSNCAAQQPAFPAGQPGQQPPPMQMPTDQGQMMPPQDQGQMMPGQDQGQMMPSQDQGQMAPQDQGQAGSGEGMQDGSMPIMQDGSMPSGDASQQKQQYGQCQQQQQQQQYGQYGQYGQYQQPQQQYGQYQQPQPQQFSTCNAGGMGMGGGPSYGGMPGAGPSYGMPGGNMYMNMMQQNPMGPYGNQPNFPGGMGMGMPPCARAAAAQGPWMNYGQGGYGVPGNMQRIYG